MRAQKTERAQMDIRGEWLHAWDLSAYCAVHASHLHRQAPVSVRGHAMHGKGATGCILMQSAEYSDNVKSPSSYSETSCFRIRVAKQLKPVGLPLVHSVHYLKLCRVL